MTCQGFFEYDSLRCFAVKMTRDADYDLPENNESNPIRIDVSLWV